MLFFSISQKETELKHYFWGYFDNYNAVLSQIQLSFIFKRNFFLADALGETYEPKVKSRFW